MLVTSGLKDWTLDPMKTMIVWPLSGSSMYVSSGALSFHYDCAQVPNQVTWPPEGLVDFGGHTSGKLSWSSQS